MATPESESSINSSISSLSPIAQLEASHFLHTPNYCEENVYFLCKKLCTDGLAASDGSDLFVVFISNEKKQIPLWNQKASQRADGVVLWDYHVICIQKGKGENASNMVWDLDSSLPFPSPLALYIAETIRPSFELFSAFQRFFRIVHAPVFLRDFASDRRHMKDPQGNWYYDPPPYEPIVAQDGSLHNLDEYIEMSSAEIVEKVDGDAVNDVFTHRLGVLVGENQLDQFFSLISIS